MGLFKKNPQKLKQIELQNIIFGTEEKKLMVSSDFLDSMSKAYVTRRMKAVNKMVEVIAMTKSPRRLFKSYDSAMENLDELINIEKLYAFKKPIPSQFKKSLEEKKDHYIECMIKRVWKAINQKSGISAGEKKDPAVFGPVLSEILEYRDRYNNVMIELIDQFYESVYGQSFRIEINYDEPVHDGDEPEIDLGEDTEYPMEEEEFGPEINLDDDGFMPADFPLFEE